jgi:hypothetical protein
MSSDDNADDLDAKLSQEQRDREQRLKERRLQDRLHQAAAQAKKRIRDKVEQDKPTSPDRSSD